MLKNRGRNGSFLTGALTNRWWLVNLYRVSRACHPANVRICMLRQTGPATVVVSSFIRIEFSLM
jgi:hypothetical protein